MAIKTVSDYNAEISDKEAEKKHLESLVERCETLDGTLKKIVESINNFIKQLNSISSCLERGLIVDGKGVGVKHIGEKVTALEAYKNNIETNCCIGITDKIKSLNASIDELHSEIADLETKRDRLWRKIYSKLKENKT